MTFTQSTTYETLTCVRCGCAYAAPAAFFDNQRRFGLMHWCVACGSTQGWKDSAETRLREQVKAQERALASKQAEIDRQREMRAKTEKRLQCMRGVVTRTKNRIGNGVCPCCSRSFADLREHMANKHPGYRGKP